MILFREKQQIVIYVVAGVMAAGFVLFRYLPLRKRIKALEQAKATQTAAIAKASAQSRQLPALEKELLELQSKVGDYQRQIPAQRALGAFLHRIADLMNEHGLKGQLVEPGKEVKIADDTKLHAIPVNMQCKGRLAQIFKFYKSLQGLGRFVRIERVKLENARDFTGEVSMQTEAVIYYRLETG